MKTFLWLAMWFTIGAIAATAAIGLFVWHLTH